MYSKNTLAQIVLKNVGMIFMIMVSFVGRWLRVMPYSLSFFEFVAELLWT